MSLSDIVSVTITTTAKGVSQAGFGTPLICGYHTEWMDYVREYEDVASLITDGILATSPIYKAASAIMSQNPHPTSFKVGRRATAFSQSVDITPTVGGTGYVHTVTVISPDGTSTVCSYTEQASDTVALICAGLQTVINAITDLTCTDDTTNLSCDADNSGELFFYNSLSASLQLQDMTADPGLAADIALIRAEDDDWYGFCLDSNSEAEIEGAQAVIETLDKIAAYNTADYGVKDSGTSDDVASDMQTSAYDRCVMLYSADHDGYGGAAWLGKMLPTTPGSSTWSYKSLASVAADTLNATEENTIEGKDCNHYTTIKGLNMIFDGRTPGGTFIDIIRGRDWLKARLEERIVQLMADNAKIPFTDKGVDLVRCQVLAQLREGQSNGYIANDPDVVVTAPLVASVSTTNKANRTLPDVQFSATLQGAIHKVEISGVVSV